MDCASVTKQKAIACKTEANKTGGGASAVRPLTADKEKVWPFSCPKTKH